MRRMVWRPVVGLIVSFAVGVPASRGVVGQRPTTREAHEAFNVVEQFCRSINDGNPVGAAAFFPKQETQPRSERGTPLRLRVERFLQTHRSQGKDKPMLIIAKRRAELLAGGYIRVRCTAIWNVRRVEDGRILRWMGPEVFVVKIGGRTPGMIQNARALPVLVDDIDNPSDMRKRLREKSSEVAPWD